jgi:inositol-phosphate phosphatase/L-galactose 1-phosphate phosphatase/histidinol-phosphatase
MSDHSRFLAFAEELADGARAILRRSFRAVPDAEYKADATPVTVADREVEAWLRARIGEAFPEHGILGEEHGDERLDAEWVWVLDPIDGTQSFASGSPLFGSLIALTHHGAPVVGALDTPIVAERWLATTGGGATFNGRTTRVRAARPLSEALFYTTSPYAFTGPLAGGLQRLRERVRIMRFSADCYAYGLLARGDIDVVIEAGLNPYDACAIAPIVLEAGGVFTQWDGAPVRIDFDGTVIAATSEELAREALELLRG